ncbi:MAG: VOC family protein [Candidatus Kapabacteria bacterium]|nr:VOC family protein [Candidatus Kapabacteria bacterium]
MEHECGVVHFEMPFDDENRVTEFYKSVFGWGMVSLGEPMGNYVLASTGDNDEKGFPLTRGRINGGFFPKSASPSQHPSVVIHVSNIEQTMQQISNAGGKVLGEPVMIPGQGLYVSFMDSEGNFVSIIQPNEDMLY